MFVNSIYFLFLKKESNKEIQGPAKYQFSISGLRYAGPSEQSWSPPAKFYMPPLRVMLTTRKALFSALLFLCKKVYKDRTEKGAWPPRVRITPWLMLCRQFDSKGKKQRMPGSDFHGCGDFSAEQVSNQMMIFDRQRIL